MLGEFTTKTSGFGDLKLGALYSVYEKPGLQVILNGGLSLPTGSTTEEDDVLTPMNMRPVLRLPYPMQLGSGTVDLEPGVTVNAGEGAFRLGAQYRATLRLGTNDEGYALGDRHQATAWVAYEVQPSVSISGRIAGDFAGTIDGIDPMIVAPVQTANPDFSGGDRLDALFGVNYIARAGALKGHRLAVEFGLPVYQNLNGPQMETDWTLTVGWQKAF